MGHCGLAMGPLVGGGLGRIFVAKLRWVGVLSHLDWQNCDLVQQHVRARRQGGEMMMVHPWSWLV